jgi:small conductance mechanosensitive channel
VINDLVSGFFILAESQFLVGDYIEVGTARGVVEAIQLRTTKVRDPNGQLHIVRNGQLAGVVNYSKRYTFAVVEIELPYAADLEKASAALRSVGEELRATHQDVLEPTTLEGVEKFGPSGVVLRTTTRVKPGTHGPVAREYRRRALNALRSMGLAPSPDIEPT